MTQRIAKEFPIESQTSEIDKQVLLQIKDLLGNYGAYHFCEIGSFLGGSMTPFVMDPHCQAILSIDDRNRETPDERGARYNYHSITHQSMLDNIAQQGLPIEKISGFDGSVDEFTPSETKFDLLFIDGEHTDVACFRDFVHGFKLMKKDSIIAFHDSDLICRALRMIQEYLRAIDVPFTFMKAKNCVVSAIFIGKYAKLNLTKHFEIEENLDEFYKNSEDALLKSILHNRLEIQTSYVIKEVPVHTFY